MKESWITRVPNSLIYNTSLSFDARALWMLLKSYDPNCFPSRHTLLRQTDWGKDKLARALKELVEAGLVQREQRRIGKQFSTNRYTLTEQQPENLKAPARSASGPISRDSRINRPADNGCCSVSTNCHPKASRPRIRALRGRDSSDESRSNQVQAAESTSQNLMTAGKDRQHISGHGWSNGRGLGEDAVMADSVGSERLTNPPCPDSPCPQNQYTHIKEYKYKGVQDIKAFNKKALRTLNWIQREYFDNLYALASKYGEAETFWRYAPSWFCRSRADWLRLSRTIGYVEEYLMDGKHVRSVCALANDHWGRTKPTPREDYEIVHWLHPELPTPSFNPVTLS